MKMCFICGSTNDAIFYFLHLVKPVEFTYEKENKEENEKKEEEEKEEDRSWKKLLYYFSQETTLHGIRFVTGSSVFVLRR